MENTKFKNIEVTWESFPGPCYDPQERFGDCPGDLISLMNNEQIPIHDRIWAFTKCTGVSDMQKRLFAVRCIRETPLNDTMFVIDLIKDERSLKAIEVAEKYALGLANENDIDSASAAAWAAAMAAALAPEKAAAMAAVSAAERNAERNAESDSAMAAAWAAERDSISDYAWSAATDSAWAAGWVAEWASESDYAMNSAMDSARNAQIQIIKSMFFE
jgi:hypothetical protein